MATTIEDIINIPEDRTQERRVQQSEVKPDPVVAGLGDSQFNYLTKDLGYDPEYLKRIYSGDYDPTKDNALLKLTNLNPPKPIDEKAVGNARKLSAIGQGLSNIAQMISAGRGAHIKADTTNPMLATESIIANEKDKYDAKYNEYLNKLNQVNIMGYNQMKAERNLLDSRYANHQKNILETAKMKSDENRWRTEAGLRGAELGIKDRDSQVDAKYKQGQLQIDQGKLGIDQQKNQIEYQKMQNETNKPVTFSVLSPNGNTTGPDGKSYKQIQMPQSQVSSMAMQAKKDKAFMLQNPELLKRVAGLFGDGATQYETDYIIAQAYLQSQEGQIQYKSNTPPPAPGYNPMAWRETKEAKRTSNSNKNAPWVK